MSTPTVVTGEAVVLQLRPATFVQRAAGALLDAALLVLALVLTLVWVVGPLLEQLDAAAAQTTMLSLLVGFLVLVPLIWETASRGRSPGKWALGLRVIRDDGGAVHLRHTMIRTLTGFFELWMTLGAVAVLASLFNARGKRLGDMAAGTTVVVSRLPPVPPPLPDVPDRMRGWAQVADIGRLPDALAVTVARFLRQAPARPPAGRRMTADRLLAAVVPYVSPGPPPGLEPEDFLLSVVAERRNRDLAILTGRRERTARSAERIRTLQS